MEITFDSAGRCINSPEELVKAVGCCDAILHVDSSIECEKCSRILYRNHANKRLVSVYGPRGDLYEVVCPNGCQGNLPKEKK